MPGEASPETHRHAGRLCRACLPALALAAAMVGCALDSRAPRSNLVLEVAEPIIIPAGRAHATFQHGRAVGASNQFKPYCELEVRAVSGAEPQRITSGDFQVSRISRRLLLDPTTRISAMSFVTSCSEPVFQELIWHLEPTAPSGVLFLRCIAPYYDCAFGPPLSPEQVQQQVGQYLIVRRGKSVHR